MLAFLQSFGGFDMKNIIFGVACAILSATAATAEDTVTWSEDAGGWKVNVDTTIDNSCFIIAAFEDQYVLRFQFNNRRRNVQFIIASTRWDSLQMGESYEMEVAFGGQEPWTGRGIGYLWRGVLPSLVLSVPLEGDQASDFIAEFRKMDDVRVAYNGRDIANLALEGNGEAIAELMACQSVMLANADPEDPFAAPKPVPGEQL